MLFGLKDLYEGVISNNGRGTEPNNGRGNVGRTVVNFGGLFDEEEAPTLRVPYFI